MVYERARRTGFLLTKRSVALLGNVFQPSVESLPRTCLRHAKPLKHGTYSFVRLSTPVSTPRSPCTPSLGVYASASICRTSLAGRSYQRSWNRDLRKALCADSAVDAVTGASVS